MTQATTEPKLTIGPQPDHTDGPVTIVFQPAGDDYPPDDLKTCPTLEAAVEFAEQCVDRGFLAGHLTYRPADKPPTVLEQLVDQEQHDHDNGAGSDLDGETAVAAAGAAVTPERGPVGAGAAPAVEKTTGYRIERITAFSDQASKIKVEKTGLTLEQAGDQLAKMRCRTGTHLRIVNPAGDTIYQKHPAGTAAPEAEPEPPEPAAEGPEEPTGQKTLVDRDDYETPALQLPKIDGQTVDRIAFAFTGQIMLDRSDPADVALFRKLTLGHDVTLQIEGSCAGYTGKQNTNRDGDLDVVVGVRRIKIHTIYLPVLDDQT